ncbi:MAG: hypothetical protein Q8Q20_01110, partial [bacterium]|nr:hypothetical protein [bacterium]
MISLFITASSIALLVLPVTGIDHSQLRQGIVENYRNAESSEERIENLRFLADSMVDQRNADLDRVKIRFESTASLSETFRLEIVDK